MNILAAMAQGLAGGAGRLGKVCARSAFPGDTKKGPPCQLSHPYATRSFVSTPLQDGQTNMSCSRRTPSFEIVRKCFMVSPQERHTMVGVLLGAGGERSLAAVEGV